MHGHATADGGLRPAVSAQHEVAGQLLHIRLATAGDTTPVEELHTRCAPRSLHQRLLAPVPRVSARALEQLLDPHSTSPPRAAARRHHLSPASGGRRRRRVGPAAAAEQPADLSRILVVVVALRPRWRGGLEPGGSGSRFLTGDDVGVATAAHRQAPGAPSRPVRGCLLPALLGEPLPAPRAHGLCASRSATRRRTSSASARAYGRRQRASPSELSSASVSGCPSARPRRRHAAASAPCSRSCPRVVRRIEAR
ncbi:hypothetical protein SAM23877_0312 [Streptomyces ambofaciens ATCC 23877]|uniref:Uncharacterized protein n=1 Tax=Streptomyces ambofaciens (strain ATCC 23877 / 3486 / DSM 40053 / JCM 4204 / NBRC 12836 / NRRL B-2516) TaxID=278992 RepID=A0A0K2AKB7_STRA7|nr:hypothetical protein SAM23877_0312 [Streptomyces ambofaciens ATCC 23877]